MMTVRTYIGPSAIAGIGLFAAEPIPKGAVIWMRNALDVVIPDEVLESLPAPAREQIEHHVYIDAVTRERILCGDNARFMNHSEEPNSGQISPDAEIALRDILPGEEITCDYRTFDLDCQAKGIEFLLGMTTSCAPGLSTAAT